MKPKVYDCFMFFNELDILEIRLNELNDAVDKFVLVESTLTHSGNPKPLYFAENKQRFSKFLDKIIHVVVDEYPNFDKYDPSKEPSAENPSPAWLRENHQRRAINKALINCNDNDIIITSDADEIPNIEAIRNYKDGVACLEMEFSYYFFNCKSKNQKYWYHAQIGKYGIIKNIDLCDLRYIKPNTYSEKYNYFHGVIPNGGWHFSYLGGANAIKNKIESWCHQELNTSTFNNTDHISKSIEEGKDLFNRGIIYEFEEINNSYPKTILNNLEYYKKNNFIKEIKNHKVYDCFMFFNEFDVLEMRLNELYDVVDKFVLVEAKYNHAGNPKPLYFGENKQRFSKFLDKITHVVIDSFPSELDAWGREQFQRRALWRGLTECKDNDIITVTDVDEIPKAEVIKKYNASNGICCLETQMCYYYLNCVAKGEHRKWHHAKIGPYGLIKKLDVCKLRYSAPNLYCNTPDLDFYLGYVKDAGWHFSFLGGVDKILNKIKSYCHQELNTEKYTNPENIVKAIESGKDIFDRDITYEIIDIDDSYPKTVLNNLEYYKKNNFIIQKNKPKVYDCFTFFNELDILEIRLNELYPYVDKFVISEMPVTHTNLPKPLYFAENKQRFSKFLDKIIHVVVDKYPEDEDPWKREHHQRSIMTNSLLDCSDDDIVIVSDVDEIPKGSKIKEFSAQNKLMYFEQKQFRQYLNCQAKDLNPDRGIFSRITTVGHIKKNNFNLTDIRYQPIDDSQKIPNGGWHFSWLCYGSGKEFIKKLVSYAHREVVNNWIFKGQIRSDIYEKINQIEYADYKDVEQEIHSSINVMTKEPLNTVEIDNSFPKFIIENKNKLIEKRTILENNPSTISSVSDVAIVMPYYNDTKFILDSVNNIIKQDYNNWTLYVVDDGSKLTSKASIALRNIKDRRIKILEKPNGGVSSARNFALDLIRKNQDYKYVAYCDSDDQWISTNYLSSQIKYLENSNSDLVYSNVVKKFEDGTDAIPYGIPDPKEYPGLEYMFKNPFIYISSVLHKSKCLNVGNFDEKLNSIEDWDMWVRMAKAGYIINKNDQTNIKYTVKTNNNMASMKNKEKEDLFNKKHSDLLVKKITLKNKEVTAYISTKDRYFTTLPSAILSIINQTVKPNYFILFDDGEQKDLREYSVYKHIFSLLDKNNISWQVIFGEKKGQVLNHQKAIDISKTDLLFRVDDDNYLEPNVLENLLKHMTEDTGAVGSRILIPTENIFNSQICSSKLEDISSKPNLQWSDVKGIHEVDHLHNSFLFRKSASSGYCLDLSPVGHREETIFSYEIKRNGFKVKVNGDVLTWHLKEQNGGIRSHKNESFYHHDEEIFQNKLKVWQKVKPNKLIVLESGLGDHLMFKQILPEIKEKYKDITLAVCYPEVFEDEGIPLISISDAKLIENDISKYNVYKWAWENQWTGNDGNLVEAYRRLYL